MWTTGATIRPTNLAFRNMRDPVPQRDRAAAPDALRTRPRDALERRAGAFLLQLLGDRARYGAGQPEPVENITLDRVYVHDITDNCSYYPEPGCNGLPAPNLDLFHVDCLQAYGGDRITIRRSRFFNCATQAIFAGTEGGGTFSNWTIENTMVGGIPRGRDGAQSNHAIFFGNQEGRPYLFGSFRFAYNTLNVDQSASFVIDPVRLGWRRMPASWWQATSRTGIRRARSQDDGRFGTTSFRTRLATTAIVARVRPSSAPTSSGPDPEAEAGLARAGWRRGLGPATQRHRRQAPSGPELAPTSARASSRRRRSCSVARSAT